MNNLNGYNTSLMAFDPKSKDFIEKMNKYPEFELNSLSKDREKYLVYIALMYDKKSELGNDMEYTYWQKKKMAAEIAGFKLKDKRFNKEVEMALLSQNEDFIKAMIRYLRFQHMPEFTQLRSYQMLHDQLIITAIKDQDTKAMKEASDLTTKIAALTEKIYGGAETSQAVEALYEDVDEIDIESIKAEGIAKKLEKGSKLEEWSPYPGYEKTEDVTFAGDEIPGN